VKRYGAKRDRSEADILAALVKVGADYLLLDAFDVLVWHRGHLTMLEVKTPKIGRTTSSQKDLVQRGWPLRFVNTPEQALAAIGAGT